MVNITFLAHNRIGQDNVRPVRPPTDSCDEREIPMKSLTHSKHHIFSEIFERKDLCSHQNVTNIFISSSLKTQREGRLLGQIIQSYKIQSTKIQYILGAVIRSFSKRCGQSLVYDHGLCLIALIRIQMATSADELGSKCI